MSVMIYTLYGFATFFFIFWCGKWVIHVLALVYGKYKLHKKIDVLPRESSYPMVSILKPLMGVDPNLCGNLETFFTMKYPVYELLFCIEDKDDPAVMVVEQLMEKYPSVEAYLFIGGSKVGVNPKINNMNLGYLAAKYEFIMISDSGIRMKEDTLLDMVQQMTDNKNVALVHQLPFTADRDGFAATFEKIYFGTMQSRIYLVSDLLGIICHTGMSSLMRKSVVDQLGGLKVFGCYLAEDFFIAKRIVDSGWKIRISSHPALQNSGICDINTFQSRLTRWAKLRVAMVPTLILLEPMAECLILGACAAWSVSFLFHWDSLVFYLIHILMWFLSDWLLLSIVQNGTLPFNKFDFVVGWLFREMTGPYLLFHALWNPEITWRTRIYKLEWGGVAYELSTKKAKGVFDTRIPIDELKDKSLYDISCNDLKLTKDDVLSDIKTRENERDIKEIGATNIFNEIILKSNSNNITENRNNSLEMEILKHNKNHSQHHHLHHYRSLSSSCLPETQHRQPFDPLMKLHCLQQQDQLQQQLQYHDNNSNRSNLHPFSLLPKFKS